MFIGQGPLPSLGSPLLPTSEMQTGAPAIATSPAQFQETLQLVDSILQTMLQSSTCEPGDPSEHLEKAQAYRLDAIVVLHYLAVWMGLADVMKELRELRKMTRDPVRRDETTSDRIWNLSGLFSHAGETQYKRTWTLRWSGKKHTVPCYPAWVL